MKRLLLMFIIMLLLPVCAEEQIAAQSPLTVPQNISFEQCTKIFPVTQEKLFSLTLASIGANKFKAEEIQTSNGYIIFCVNRNRYLATVATVDSANSILKITPCNNVYNFPPGILINLFKYIELNLKNT